VSATKTVISSPSPTRLEGKAEVEPGREAEPEPQTISGVLSDNAEVKSPRNFIADGEVLTGQRAAVITQDGRIHASYTGEGSPRRSARSFLPQAAIVDATQRPMRQRAAVIRMTATPSAGSTAGSSRGLVDKGTPVDGD
jgi:hypothetical protein